MSWNIFRIISDYQAEIFSLEKVTVSEAEKHWPRGGGDVVDFAIYAEFETSQFRVSNEQKLRSLPRGGGGV